MKDKITNYCGLIAFIGGSVLAAHASGQIVLPGSVVLSLGLAVTIATAVVSWFTGKTVK